MSAMKNVGISDGDFTDEELELIYGTKPCGSKSESNVTNEVTNAQD